MKAIICGGRNYYGDPDVDYQYLDRLRVAHNITEVVSGGAKGADQIGERWARSRRLTLTIFRAKWDLYGRRAGPIRNQDMLDYIQGGDRHENSLGIVIAFPGGTGTKHMMAISRRVNIPVIEISRIVQSDMLLKNGGRT